MKVTIIALAVAAALLLWRLDHVSGELEAERMSHAATARERDQWRAAAEAAQGDAEAQAENARLCLEREARAAKSAEERAVIMRQAAPRSRTDAEKGQVVDDETRNRVAARLNRPL